MFKFKLPSKLFRVNGAGVRVRIKFGERLEGEADRVLRARETNVAE